MKLQLHDHQLAKDAREKYLSDAEFGAQTTHAAHKLAEEIRDLAVGIATELLLHPGAVTLSLGEDVVIIHDPDLVETFVQITPAMKQVFEDDPKLHHYLERIQE